MDIAIVLAAGEGTRMRSKRPKVLHRICGMTLLEYVLDASIGAKIEKNIVITGHGGEKVKKHFKDKPIIFKDQPIGEDVPYGTGFAVMQAEDMIEDDSTVVILCGDTPLITADTLKKFVAYHKEGQYHGTVLTALLDEPAGYGRIKRDKKGNISKIVEDKDASEEEKEINEINSGIFCFNGRLLKGALKKLDDNNAQNELYITDVVEILNREGYKIGGYIIEDSIEIYGVNSRNQLAFCEKVMRERINKAHMEKGVTLIDPSATYIEPKVIIGADTTIYPGVVLEGNTSIGRDCVIRTGTRIVDSKIEDGVVVESSLIEASKVGQGSNIGPNAHLRPDSRLGKNVKIGNFVEVKNATIGDNTKAGHLAYVGDAIVGRNVNIGCGVIFANYDGVNKHVVTVGDNAFVGSNSNLVAPLKVNDYAYIAAGSTITKEVEKGALAIERGTQVNKEGWVEKRGLKKNN